jgi:tRNA pseudouridine55 synthase
MPTGFLILDKPSGPTSHDMVYFVRRGMGEKRVGHAGTLDPLATGVLVICLGSATRLSEYLLGESKRYRATARFGAATTTYDAQGEVTATAPVTIGRRDIEAALASFRGDLLQVPPAYSAVKRGGLKAYEAARRGEALALEPRPISVYEIRLEDWQPPDAVINVHCSAGAYVRSLVHDLGQALGCGAHLIALRRTASGHFELSQAVTEQALREAFGDGSWKTHLLPVRAALPHWPAVHLDAASVERVSHGQAIRESSAGYVAGSEMVEATANARQLALAFGPGDRLIAVVERDHQACAWKPKKVLQE